MLYSLFCRLFGTFVLTISWPQLFKRAGRSFYADDCLTLGSQLAYAFFLALFPALLFLLSLASFFPLASAADHLVGTLAPVAPYDVLMILHEQMVRISKSDHGGILTIGFLGALLSSTLGMVSTMGALNHAFETTDARPYWKRVLVAAALTFVLGAVVLVGFTAVVAGPKLIALLGNRWGLGLAARWAWTIGRWPLAFLLNAWAVGLVFHYGPDVSQRWEWLTPGAVAATTGWVIASAGFRLYVTRVVDYQAAYGAIGGVIVLLTWFYVSSLALLFGAELNGTIERTSPRRSSTPPRTSDGRRAVNLRHVVD